MKETSFSRRRQSHTFTVSSLLAVAKKRPLPATASWFTPCLCSARWAIRTPWGCQGVWETAPLPIAPAWDGKPAKGKRSKVLQQRYTTSCFLFSVFFFPCFCGQTWDWAVIHQSVLGCAPAIVWSLKALHVSVGDVCTAQLCLKLDAAPKVSMMRSQAGNPSAQRTPSLGFLSSTMQKAWSGFVCAKQSISQSVDISCV